MNKPIFEVFYKNGIHYKIYEDGNIDGSPDDPMIINRIPARISTIQGAKLLLLRSLRKIQQISLKADCMDQLYNTSAIPDKE